MSDGILFEVGDCWVRRAVFGRGKTPGYQVMRNVGTHAVVAFNVALPGAAGLARVMSEARRLAAEVHATQ